MDKKESTGRIFERKASLIFRLSDENDELNNNLENRKSYMMPEDLIKRSSDEVFNNKNETAFKNL